MHLGHMQNCFQKVVSFGIGKHHIAPATPCWVKLLWVVRIPADQCRLRLSISSRKRRYGSLPQDENLGVRQRQAVSSG